MKISFTPHTIEGMRTAVTVAVLGITGEMLSVVYQILQFVMEFFFSSQ
jgi:hypothetical protein